MKPIHLAPAVLAGTAGAFFLAYTFCAPAAPAGPPAAAGDAAAVGDDEEADAATRALSAAPDDPVARLQRRLDAGETRLEWDPDKGYLPAVLRALEIPASSQGLVFSKTSLQLRHISPRTPRAIYFNDRCYVGWVPGGEVLEVSAADARWGGVFYTLDQRRVARPRFARRTLECLACHASPMTGNVPGHVVRSVFARADGNPAFSGGSFVSTHESPLDERWGGWFVTGRHGRQRHMGNSFARGDAAASGGEITLDREAGANVTDLSRFLDTAPYLTPHSDIVALMVLEHQTLVHNRITKANFLTRDALRDERRMNAFEGKPAGESRPATESRIRAAAEPLVQALLLVNEAKLTDTITGTSGFAREFAAPGPRDRRGRSLRELDLRTRLLRHPCSFLIYDPAFDALPAPVRDYAYRRLREVLTGADTSKTFAHLSAADRQAILEILNDTKPDFAAAVASATDAAARPH